MANHVNNLYDDDDDNDDNDGNDSSLSCVALLPQYYLWIGISMTSTCI